MEYKLLQNKQHFTHTKLHIKSHQKQKELENRQKRLEKENEQVKEKIGLNVKNKFPISKVSLDIDFSKKG